MVALLQQAHGQITNVYTGTAPNTGTGDPLRTAFEKLNTNDVVLWQGLTGLSNFLASPTAVRNALAIGGTAGTGSKFLRDDWQWVTTTFPTLGWFDVKSYGAVGNGVNNDANAIQSAIEAAAAAGGGIVYFPRGTYMVQSNTVSQPYVTPVCLHLHGQNIVLLGEDRAGTIIRVMSSVGSATSLLYVREATNVVVRNLTLDGNWIARQVNDGSECEGIHVYSDWQNVHLESLTVTNTPEDGIDIHLGYGLCTVQDVLVTDCAADGIAASDNNGRSIVRMQDVVVQYCGLGTAPYLPGGLSLYDNVIVDGALLISNRINIRAINPIKARILNATLYARDGGANIWMADGGTLELSSVRMHAPSTATNLYMSSSGAGGALFVHNTIMNGGVGMYIARANRVYVEGGEFVASQHYAFAFDNVVNDWRIVGASLRNYGGSAIKLSQYGGNGILAACQLYYHGASMVNNGAGATNLCIDACRFIGAGGNAIYLGAGARNVRISHIQADGTVTLDGAAGNSIVSSMLGGLSCINGALSNTIALNVITNLSGASQQQRWLWNVDGGGNPAPSSAVAVVGNAYVGAYIGDGGAITNLSSTAFGGWIGVPASQPPTSAPVPGMAALWNSNGVVYLLTTLPGGTTWAATNRLAP